MPSKWDTVELESLVDPERGISYGIVQPGTPTDGGVPIVRVSDIRDGRILTADPLRVSPTIEAGHSRTRLRGGELLLTLVGTVGEAAVVPDALAGWNTARAVAVIPVRKEIGSYWVKLALRTPAVRQIIDSRLNTTVQPTLNLRDVAQLPIVLPPQPQRQAITYILGTIDEKIELNRQMNETLHAMTQTLFKSWFLDFDPVRAKAEGRDTGLPRPIADLFPDSFRDSELGENPRGWRVQPFADSVEILGGGMPKTSIPEYWSGDIPWFSVVDAPAGASVWVIETERRITREGLENSAARILPFGTTIISARGTVGRIALVGVPMAMNQSCYGLRGKWGGKGFFTYFATRHLVASLQRHAHGSVFDTITRDTLASVPVAVPTPEIVEAFESRVGPGVERIRAGLFESRTLAALRDTLLLKLISGELRLKDPGRIGRHPT